MICFSSRRPSASRYQTDTFRSGNTPLVGGINLLLYSSRKAAMLRKTGEINCHKMRLRKAEPRLRKILESVNPLVLSSSGFVLALLSVRWAARVWICTSLFWSSKPCARVTRNARRYGNTLILGGVGTRSREPSPAVAERPFSPLSSAIRRATSRRASTSWFNRANSASFSFKTSCRFLISRPLLSS